MVKNVLKAYTNLNLHTNKIKIVPVCINYERLFDASYLADEAKLGTFKPGTTLVSLMQKIMTMKQGHMGKVFVKYGEAIDIHDYVNNYISVNHSSQNSRLDFEKLSMKLTEDLYINQMQEQPITQNSLIASSILFHPNKTMSFKHIKTAC
jgi:glycerol-3-phosphate O-acyltransferase